MSLDVVRAYRSMVLRPEDSWMRDDPMANAEIETNIMAGPSIALPDNDNPAVIFGIYHAYGVGTVWMIVGDRFKDKWRMVFRAQKSLCRTMSRALRIRRLQILVDANQPAHCRYAEFVGFERESVNPHCGMGPRGEDMIFYIWKERETEK